MATSKWLGNVPRDEASREIARLCAGWIGRRIVEGEPQASDAEGVASLKAADMVGLYHIGADDPVTVEVVTGDWASRRLAEGRGDRFTVPDGET